MRCALNYARYRGFNLEERPLRSDADVLALMGELRKKGGDSVRLVRDDEGAFHLEAYRQASEELHLYYIPVGPTWLMRPETGELLRRYIKALSVHFLISDILDVPAFDYEMSSYEDSYTEQMMTYKQTGDEADRPEAFFMEDWLRAHEDYLEGGEAYGRIMEFRAAAPLTEGELDRFEPVTEAEESLVRLLRDGFALMRSDTSIWGQRDTMYKTEAETEQMMNEGFVGWEDQCFISYEDDHLLECIVDSLNNLVNSGAVPEGITAGGHLPETGDPDFHEDVADILRHIDRLCDLLTDSTLIQSKNTTKAA